MLSKTKSIILFLFFSSSLLSWGETPNPLAKLNQMLFFSSTATANEGSLNLYPNNNFDLILSQETNILQTGIKYEQENQLLFSAILKMSPRSIADSNLEAILFDGLSIQPTLYFEFKDIRLKVRLDGSVAPIFTPSSFSSGNYILHNQLTYIVQIDLLDFLLPKKRDYSTNIYFSGDVSQYSGYEDFTEQRMTNKTNIRFGLHYRKPRIAHFSTGFSIITEEKIDLSLPHPKEDLVSRFNLDLELKLFYENLEVKMNFTPNINRKGNIQDSVNTIFALSSIYKISYIK